MVRKLAHGSGRVGGAILSAALLFDDLVAWRSKMRISGSERSNSTRDKCLVGRLTSGSTTKAPLLEALPIARDASSRDTINAR